MSDLATVTVILSHGIPFKNTRLKSIVIREPLLDDLIAAEGEANGVLAPLAFRRALVAHQIVSADGEALPITPEMLGKLKGNDWNKLSLALNEAERLGEAESSDCATT